MTVVPTLRSPRSAVAAISVASVVLGLAASATIAVDGGLQPDGNALVGATLLWLGIATFVIRGLPTHRHDAFGAANAVTLARAAIIVAITALIPIGTEADDALGATGRTGAEWFVSAAALVALALDAVDGALARAAKLTSDFGARFDVEIDALLSLVLSVMLWRIDKLGPWILALGLLRYGFVVAGAVWPALGGELPPSTRRRLIGVAQLGTLAVIVAPPVTRGPAAPLAFTVLIATTASFGVDTWRLLGRAGRPDQ